MASRYKFGADEIKAIEEARKVNKDKRAEARLTNGASLSISPSPEQVRPCVHVRSRGYGEFAIWRPSRNKSGVQLDEYRVPGFKREEIEEESETIIFNRRFRSAPAHRGPPPHGAEK